MASADDVKKLAALARLTISDETLPKLAKEFESILAYVSQLDSLDVSGTANERPPVRNVFREDGEPHAGGAYTERIAAQFPKREGDALSVKQIISHD